MVDASGTEWSPTYLTQVRSESNTMTKWCLHGLPVSDLRLRRPCDASPCQEP